MKTEQEIKRKLKDFEKWKKKETDSQQKLLMMNTINVLQWVLDLK